jgi:hypothetical protein
MKLTWIKVLVIGWGFLLGPEALWAGQAWDLFPNTPDEVIVSRAAGQPKPLWQIPLGPALVDALQEARQGGAGDKEAGRMISLATLESRRYQNMSRDYSARSFSAASRGDTWGSTMLGAQATFAQREDAFQATMGAAIAITHLAMMYRQFLYARSIKTFIERQSLFRKSILSSYAQAETDEFVYRPDLDYRDPADTFSALSVVHLPTGKRSETILSPHYLSYGLWQVVDFDKGVVYHSNIGMEPARYELSESRAYCPYRKARTVNTFLIAQPVKAPR